MLKLTNSFYRYLTVTCERVDYKAHVKKYSHLCCLREICRTDCVSLQLKGQFHCNQVLRKHSNTKKRIKIKIPPLNSNEFDRTEQMSESVQPTSNHVSYGGSFSVSSDDDSPSKDWRNTTGGSHVGKRKQSVVPLNFRCWESVVRKSDCNNGTSFKFKVMSYNVLAQYLLECHPYLYTDCSPLDLKWEVRSTRLYNEIVTLAPDILCLQEVQVSYLSSFYSKFEEIGYFGIYKKRTGHREDGCAIYFKKSLFEMKDHITVEFYQPQLPLLNRDNIGLMVKLVPRCAPHNPIVVATTHLLYNPKRTDVRLAQIQLFLAEIDRFAFYNNGKEYGRIPIILTGDLNSTPESAVIKLLDRGHVSAHSLRDSSDWQRIGVTDNCQHLSVFLDRQAGRQTDFKSVKIFNSDYSGASPTAEGACAPSVPPPEEQFNQFFNGAEVCQSLQLTSVYDKYKPDGNYEASTFQDYWVTVDYIYFSCRSYLHLTDRLRLPTSVECYALNRLPNDVYASDHLALAAVFEIQPILGRAVL